MRQGQEEFQVSNMGRVYVPSCTSLRPPCRDPLAAVCTGTKCWDVPRSLQPHHDASSDPTRHPAREGASAPRRDSGQPWVMELPVVLVLGVWKWRVSNFVTFLKLFPFLAILSTKQILWPCACVKFTFHNLYNLKRKSNFLGKPYNEMLIFSYCGLWLIMRACAFLRCSTMHTLLSLP